MAILFKVLQVCRSGPKTSPQGPPPWDPGSITPGSAPWDPWFYDPRVHLGPLVLLPQGPPWDPWFYDPRVRPRTLDL